MTHLKVSKKESFLILSNHFSSSCWGNSFTQRDKVNWVNKASATTEISLNKSTQNNQGPNSVNTHTHTHTHTHAHKQVLQVSGSNPCFRQAVFAEDEAVHWQACGILIPAQLHSPLPPLFLCLHSTAAFSLCVSCSAYTLYKKIMWEGDKMGRKSNGHGMFLCLFLSQLLLLSDCHILHWQSSNGLLVSSVSFFCPELLQLKCLSFLKI